MLLPEFLDHELDSNDCPYDVLWEIERAKQHPQFQDFMKWLIQKYELPDDHIWGGPEEPVQELLDFGTWLIEIGRGRCSSKPNMDTSNDAMKEPRLRIMSDEIVKNIPLKIIKKHR